MVKGMWFRRMCDLVPKLDECCGCSAGVGDDNRENLHDSFGSVAKML